MWLLVAPLGADSETGGSGVKDVAKKIKQPESYYVSTCCSQSGILAEAIGATLLIMRHTNYTADTYFSYYIMPLYWTLKISIPLAVPLCAQLH